LLKGICHARLDERCALFRIRIVVDVFLVVLIRQSTIGIEGHAVGFAAGFLVPLSLSLRFLLC
jgi:hypothetical protein